MARADVGNSWQAHGIGCTIREPGFKCEFHVCLVGWLVGSFFFSTDPHVFLRSVHSIRDWNSRECIFVYVCLLVGAKSQDVQTCRDVVLLLVVTVATEFDSLSGFGGSTCHFSSGSSTNTSSHPCQTRQR